MATTSASAPPSKREITGRGSQPQLQVIHAAPAAIAMSKALTSSQYDDISLLAPPYSRTRTHTYSRSTPDHHYGRQRRRPSLPSSFLQRAPIAPTAPPSTSSASLFPPTAQGHSIPLDHESTSYRTSALRELSGNYPSRYRYARSTSAQSTTYSQPVIVRTYSGPTSKSPSFRGSHSSSRLRYPYSSSAPQSFPVTQNAGPGLLSSSMARAKYLTRRKGRTGHADDQLAHLPPVDAFSFKSFLADTTIQNDIGSDLDRIAEICARSRYSLSNQYEVHVAPHGSGAAFIAGQALTRGGVAVGPTLQNISPDEERGHRKRKSLTRRRSATHGTLETIMSSSRSSEEDTQHKKKSAPEIVDQVRVRVHDKETLGPFRSAGDDAPCGPQGSQNDKTTQDRDSLNISISNTQQLAKKKSTSFATAIMDSSRHTPPAVSSTIFVELSPQDISSQRNPSGALHSDPALPQTSGSHLEIRTGPEQNGNGPNHAHDPTPLSLTESSYDSVTLLRDNKADMGQTTNILSTLGSWIHWGGLNTSRSNEHQNGAEGSLRELLKNTQSQSGKGKSVD